MTIFAAAGGTHVGQVGDEPVVRGQEGAQADHPQAQGPQRVRPSSPAQQQQQNGRKVSGERGGI